MKIGVLVPLCVNIENEFMKMKDLDIYTCQLCGWDEGLFTAEMADKIVESAKKYGIEITGFWCGWPGPRTWDFYAGPVTLGLVPPAYRMERCKMLCEGSDFAKKIGVSDIITHVGFIPENPCDTNYLEVVEIITYIARYCKKNNQYFLFETGQETPITLKRLIHDTGMDNLGINLDPANLLLYGKANPVDALDIFGEYVRGVHAKDGEYPTNGRELGEEKPLGQGRVDFEKLIAKLAALKYKGALTIEREISGDEQTRDIISAKNLLNGIIEKYKNV